MCPHALFSQAQSHMTIYDYGLDIVSHAVEISLNKRNSYSYSVPNGGISSSIKGTFVFDYI